MTEPFGLNPDEIAEAERVINRAPAGLYTLAKLYGADWNTKFSPTTFGARFRATVARQHLPGISLHPKKTTANALQYWVNNC